MRRHVTNLQELSILGRMVGATPKTSDTASTNSKGKAAVAVTLRTMAPPTSKLILIHPSPAVALKSIKRERGVRHQLNLRKLAQYRSEYLSLLRIRISLNAPNPTTDCPLASARLAPTLGGLRPTASVTSKWFLSESCMLRARLGLRRCLTPNLTINRRCRQSIYRIHRYRNLSSVVIESSNLSWWVPSITATAVHLPTHFQLSISRLELTPSYSRLVAAPPTIWARLTKLLTFEANMHSRILRLCPGHQLANQPWQYWSLLARSQLSCTAPILGFRVSSKSTTRSARSSEIATRSSKMSTVLICWRQLMYRLKSWTSFSIVWSPPMTVTQWSQRARVTASKSSLRI